MRLPPLSEHIKFQRREQRLHQHVLANAAVGGFGGRSAEEAARSDENAETIQNKTVLDPFAKKVYICNVLELL